MMISDTFIKLACYNITAEARTITIDPKLAHDIHAVWAIQGMLQH
jgi:hypothetical protein